MSEDKPTTFCHRHPNHPTLLRCAACDVPICPDCLVQTPTGAKCRSCGTSPLFHLSTSGAIAVVLAGILLGAGAGWGVEFVGYMSLLLGLAYGTLSGEVVLRASRHKRGLLLELTAVISILLGAIAGRTLVAWLVVAAPGGPTPPAGAFQTLIELVSSPAKIIGLGSVMVGLLGRIRYS